MQENQLAGHLSVFITILIWGTTFISTNVLLVDFTPLEILFFRFSMGLLALMLIYPQRLKVTDNKQELYFAGAGLCGVTLYFLLENIALTYSMASNVGVISCIAPFFTALFSYYFLGGEKLRANFLLGFGAALFGISLITFNSSTSFQLNPLGDFLAVLATIVWAAYSIFTKKISAYGYNTIQMTRRIFAYGLVFMLPALFFLDFRVGLERFANPVNLFNIIFLGLGASAMCFVTWNFSVKLLGVVKTSIYIYLVPVITVVTSVIVLKEQITLLAIVGSVLTVSGVFISDSQNGLKLLANLVRKR